MEQTNKFYPLSKEIMKKISDMYHDQNIALLSPDNFAQKRNVKPFIRDNNIVVVFDNLEVRWLKDGTPDGWGLDLLSKQL